jgi:hypothetical protein
MWRCGSRFRDPVVPTETRSDSGLLRVVADWDGRPFCTCRCPVGSYHCLAGSCFHLYGLIQDKEVTPTAYRIGEAVPITYDRGSLSYTVETASPIL